jgi:hypothetical protein
MWFRDDLRVDDIAAPTTHRSLADKCCLFVF